MLQAAAVTAKLCVTCAGLGNISEQQSLGVSLQSPLGASLTSVGPCFRSLLSARAGKGLAVEHRDGGRGAWARVGGPRGCGVLGPLVIRGVASCVQRGECGVQVTRAHRGAQGQSRD